MRHRIAPALAVLFLALALKGVWGGASAKDNSRVKVSLYGVSHMLGSSNDSPRRDCSWWFATGEASLCAPAPYGGMSYALLRATFPIMSVALLLSLFAAAGLAHSRMTEVGVVAVALVLTIGDALLFREVVPSALAVFDTLGSFQFGGLAVSSAALAIAALCIACIVSGLRHRREAVE